MTRQELVKASGGKDNGAFSTVLEELEQCGFIRLYEPFSTTNKMTSDIRQKRNTLFQLVDFYTLFYFRFIRHNKYQDSSFWSSSQNSQLYHTWAGLSFEMLCLNHIDKIKHALGISGSTDLGLLMAKQQHRKGSSNRLADRPERWKPSTSVR